MTSEILNARTPKLCSGSAGRFGGGHAVGDGFLVDPRRGRICKNPKGMASISPDRSKPDQRRATLGKFGTDLAAQKAPRRGAAGSVNCELLHL